VNWVLFSHWMKWKQALLNYWTKERIVLLLIIGAWTVSIGYLCWIRHISLASGSLDLGVMEQSIWMTIHKGKLLYNTVEGVSHLRIHFSPILLLITPLYFIYQHASTLLFLQSLGLALGAFPLYLEAEERLRGKLKWVVVAVYLLYPATWSIAFFDFHPVAFAVPLLLSAYRFMRKNRRKPFYVTCSLSLFCKETVALPLIILVL